MADARQKRLSELRKQKRDIEKEIKATQNTSKMEKDFANQKSLTELKEKFEKELRNHPAGKNKTLKWLLNQPDYYHYARWTQNYSYKGNSLELDWVKKAMADGVSEQELIASANKMRENAWMRAERAKRKKRKSKGDSSNDSPKTPTKAKGTDATKVHGMG